MGRLSLANRVFVRSARTGPVRPHPTLLRGNNSYETQIQSTKHLPQPSSDQNKDESKSIATTNGWFVSCE